ncbi:MAG: hypothetical protein HOO96_36535, partial [Polyangiaceae bacterium]|nr:hypothetical protein [Polyangiaceae bacterium]
MTVAAPTFSTSDLSCTGLTSTTPFFLFQYEPKTAAQVLQYEETLICAASKLTELAEAEKPLTWSNGLVGLTATGGGATGYPNNAIDLPTSPPIARGPNGEVPAVTFRVVLPKDKFLLRDLAMELLSYVPLIDQLPLKISSGATWYQPSQLLAAPSPSSDMVALAYNAPSLTPATTDAQKYYPPLELNAAGSAVDWAETGRRHLEMESANLRAAAQLMQDLIQKNVYAALAGAAQKAATLPPSERGKALWADGSDGNSAAEISRTLFGRMGTLGMQAGLVSQKNCATVAPAQEITIGGTWIRPEDAWKTFAPPGLLQRGDDVPKQKFYGASADKLLAGSSFVPNSTLTPANVRTEVYTQLNTSMAANAGLTPTAFAVTPTGQILKSQVDAISDSTMRGAVTRQTATLRSLTNAANPAANINALTSLAYAPAALGNGNGWKVNQPLPRQLYEGDIFGPLGAIQAAAECTGSGAGPAT